MTHVVTENCQDCRFTECVETCPVNCFHSDGYMMYIDPEVCIDCSACIPVCPVQAIYEEDSLPDEYDVWLEINASEAKKHPVLKHKEAALPTAEEKRIELGFS